MELHFGTNFRSRGAPKTRARPLPLATKHHPQSRCLVSIFVHYSVILLQELDRCAPLCSKVALADSVADAMEASPPCSKVPLADSVEDPLETSPPCSNPWLRRQFEVALSELPRWLASDIRSDRYPNRARRKSRSSCRKLHFDGRWFLQSTVQIMLCKYSKKGSCTCGTSLRKPHRANESSFHSASFAKRRGEMFSERRGAG